MKYTQPVRTDNYPAEWGQEQKGDKLGIFSRRNDNHVGVDKSEYDDEDEYLDAVSDAKEELWPDNDELVDKDDYDTLEEYLEAVREERGY